MTKDERRISERVPAEFQVNYVHDGDYLISHSKDISIDGMFLFTEEPPPVGEKTNLSFAMGNLPNVEVEAIVVWVNPIDSSKDSGMAVKFINPTQEANDIILKIINKVAVLPE